MAVLSSPWQQIVTTPPTTRTFTIVTLVLSIAYQYLAYVTQDSASAPSNSFSYLVLRPGAVIWYPWTLITSSFIETHVIELVVSMVTLPLSLRYLERLWGSIETAKFILIVCGVSSLISICINYLEYTVLGMPETFLYGMYYSGTMALQTGVLVAFTQLIPEHQVQLFGVIKVRVKRLPMAYVTFSNIMCIIGFQSPYILIQFGWLVSWIYLRFYKRTSTEGATTGGVETWGDRSDTFAFVHWFPPFAHYPVTLISDAVYNAATSLKLVRAYPSTDLEGGGYAPLGSGNTRAEAERRRAMALKALDQRMAATNATNKANRQAPTETTGETHAGPSRPTTNQQSPPRPVEASTADTKS